MTLASRPQTSRNLLSEDISKIRNHTPLLWHFAKYMADSEGARSGPAIACSNATIANLAMSTCATATFQVLGSG